MIFIKIGTDYRPGILIVDDEDRKWWLSKLKIQVDDYGYAMKWINYRIHRLHRDYYEYKTGQFIDENHVIHHKNNNYLDNRFCNLELVLRRKKKLK